MKKMLTALAMGMLVLALGCAEKEPQRGLIQKKVEKSKDGKVLLEENYYVNRSGTIVPHGVTKRMFPDGTLRIQGEFKDGKSIGEWLEFYPDGKKKGSVMYKDGLVEGAFQAWYANGQLQVKGSNVRGLQDGEWIYYAEDGKVSRTERWREGEDLTGRPKLPGSE
ncbi:hypothetical protein BVY04_01830 [bacterium M21]|nr:hypothetical protein BVY04_01830 [bacterium M21]